MNNKVQKPFKFKLRDRAIVIIDWANVYGWFSQPESRNYLGWEIDLKKLFDYLATYSDITDKRLYHGIEVGNKRSEDFGAEVESVGFILTKKDVKWVPVYLNEENHFKTVVKKLFDVLDGIKITNSDIATKLYELRIKIKSWVTGQEPDFNVDDLIEKLDVELKKLNINIEDLQRNLLKPVKRRKCDFDVEIARDVCNLSNSFDTLLLFSGDGDYAALVEDLISKGKKVIVVFAPGHIGREYDPLCKELKKNNKGYALFICSVDHLKDDISIIKNIPVDFSTGRDDGNISN